MSAFLESLRLGLIRWNVTPIIIVAGFMYFSWLIIQEILDPACEKTEWYVTILAGLVTGISTFLFKIYENLQKDRGKCEH